MLFELAGKVLLCIPFTSTLCENEGLLRSSAGCLGYKLWMPSLSCPAGNCQLCERGN